MSPIGLLFAQPGETQHSMGILLTLKAPITTAAGDSLGYFYIVFFLRKIRLDISCESSAGQSIHMKNQAFFSSKDKLQFLFGTLRGNSNIPCESLFDTSLC